HTSAVATWIKWPHQFRWDIFRVQPETMAGSHGRGRQVAQNLSLVALDLYFGNLVSREVLAEHRREQLFTLIAGQRRQDGLHLIGHENGPLTPPLSGRPPVWRSPRGSGRTTPSRGGRCPWRRGSGGASPSACPAGAARSKTGARRGRRACRSAARLPRASRPPRPL